MKKILIIEDDAVVANIYHHKLLSAGYEVQVALDGEKGLQKLQDFQPDLIQLDLMLPKLNGVSLNGEPKNSQAVFVNGPKKLPIQYKAA